MAADQDDATAGTQDMHEDFADWLRAAHFPDNRETIGFRWRSVNKVVEELTVEQGSQLITPLYQAEPVWEPIRWFQKACHDDDPVFPMDGSNQVELKALAMATLTLHFHEYDDHEISAQLAMRVLTASAAQSRTPCDNPLLIDISESVIKHAALNTRARQPLTVPNIKVPQLPDSVMEAINGVTTAPPTMVKAHEAVVEFFSKKMMPSVDKGTATLVEKLNQQLAIRDEELNVLWWIVNGYSDILESPLSDLPSVPGCVAVGLELARLTKRNVELPSLKALIHRAGVLNDERISIKDLVNGTAEHTSLFNAPETPINAVITPLHDALAKQQQIGSSWSTPWSAASGLKPTLKATAIDWAIQYYRERLILST